MITFVQISHSKTRAKHWNYFSDDDLWHFSRVQQDSFHEEIPRNDLHEAEQINRENALKLPSNHGATHVTLFFFSVPLTLKVNI